MFKSALVAATATASLVLSACSSSPPPAQEPPPAQVQSNGNTWTSRLAALKTALEGATQNSGVQIQQMPDNRLHVVMPNERSFDVGRATVKRELAQVLAQIAEGLRNAPSAQVLIVGHTDSTGGASANQKLSLARAENARSAVVTRGVPGAAVKVEGRGATEPIADNATAAGRAQNRRVDIYISDRD